MMRDNANTLTTFISATIFVLFLVIGCSPNKGARIPVADFFSYPEKTNFKISPDGRYVSFLGSDNQGQRHIFLLDMEAEDPKPELIRDSIEGVSSYHWVNDDELIFTVKTSENHAQQVFAVSLSDRSVRQLTEPSDSRFRFIASVRRSQNEIIVAMNDRDSSMFDVYRLNTQNGHKKMIFRNPGNVIRWFADLEGELRLALASDSIQETMLYRRSEKEDFKPIMRNSFHTSVIPFGFVKNKKDHIYALSNVNRDKLSLVELDMRTGNETEVLFNHDEMDVNQAGYSSETGEMLYAFYFTDRRQRHYLSSDIRTIHENLEAHLPGYEYRIMADGAMNRKLIVNAFTDSDPGSVYYYDGISDRLVKLAELNPKLNAQDMATMEPIMFEARDGTKIHGYLTKPKRGSSKSMPVIVYPHEGPSERNVWGFNPEVQFFANRGYAVFQLNYRGSTGYGKEFWTAGFKEWGGKIQDDITDGVKWLIQEKIADPDRIGIYGVGFGGYSALYGACFNPELYAGAASYAGFTNLFTHLKEVPPHLKPYLQMYYEIIGNPETESAHIKAMSPVFHANKIQIPIFIAQGGRDTRSTVPETNQFVHKLRKRNIPVTYIVHEEEGRFFRKEENLIDFYEELGKFFDVNLRKR